MTNESREHGETTSLPVLSGKAEAAAVIKVFVTSHKQKTDLCLLSPSTV